MQQISKKIKIICFDLDGVLINSLKNMNYAWKMTCLENKLKVPFFKYKKYIGLTFFDILEKLDIKKNKKKIFSDYNKFSKKKINLIKLYPFINKELKKIKKKYLIGLITSKNRKRTTRIIDKFRLKFDFVYTPDDLKRGKPNPESILKIKKIFKVKSNEILYIGDTIHDYTFSINSRINFLFANWGYGNIVNKKICKIKKLSEIYKFL